MKKIFIIFLSLFISCGPSEAEIQAQIDQAVEEALEVSEDTTTTTPPSSSTTSSTTSTSTTTTTQVLSPLINMDLCPSEVTSPNGFKITYTLVARTSDIESVTIKTYQDSELLYDQIYTSSEFTLPKAGQSKQFESTYNETGDTSIGYRLRTTYEVTNKAGLSFRETCETRVKPKPVVTTTTTTPKVKAYPPDPSSDTWLRFSGTNNGSVLIDLSNMSPGLKIAYIEYTGSDYFNVTGYDSNNTYIELNVSNIGNYVGVVPINFNYENYYSLQVEGNGNYEIVVKPVSASLNFNVPTITTSGDQVIESYDLEVESKKITFEYVGDDYVSVIEYTCNGGYNGLKVTEIGSYTGTYLSSKGTCFIVVGANSGTWTISK